MSSAKSKKTLGLGKALIRNRFQTNVQNGLRMKVNPDGSSVKHTTEIDESTKDWSRMQSITQENDLDAFLTTATLAGTEFTAEKLNIEVIAKDQKNPFLLSKSEEQETLKLHKEHKALLTVPRRPVWDGAASPDVQKYRERESFLNWRRGLVELEEEKGLLMTPYERNIEVWRQLWRVLEKSDLIVQIVDARHPTMFRSTDLEAYVREVDSRKGNLLLVNKADMLTVRQREAWASYFEKEGVEYVFFSAALARRRLEEEAEAEVAEIERIEREIKEKEVREEIRKMGLSSSTTGDKSKKKGGVAMFAGLRDLKTGEDGTVVDTDAVLRERESSDAAEVEDEDSEDSSDFVDITSPDTPSVPKREPNDQSNMHISNAWQKGGSMEEEPDRIKILSCDELLELIAKRCPAPLRPGEKKTTIGFVGYPNVGKSSTLNALVGTKKVTVSSTPGKTKHFQTIHLDESMILCDCPGLVFPSFATTKAEMVVNGILPIDQLREHTGPSTLVAQRIPRHALSIIYGIKIRTFDEEGNLDPTATVKGEQLCAAYAVNRGFKKAGQGNPDEARAARIILKDYVVGKLLFCQPPPGNYDPADFNIETYSGEEFFPKKKRAQTHEVAGQEKIVENQVAESDEDSEPEATNVTAADEANINRSLDSTFFKQRSTSSGVSMKGKFQSGGFTRTKLYPHQVGAVASAGESIVVKANVKGKARSVQLPTAAPGMGLVGVDPSSKKHKKEKRGKVRVNWTKDERND
ncbi:hypothetical protein HK100_011042 [Physocladia obscura]|uniref:CP-type G domain-containing protein n=1 Tax=Physocladia obscura TaxID=109957 RepID=A0AAD5T1S6_9FUNG|nr:hypothetical protein HK100_011042 [Physocladia obscura]